MESHIQYTVQANATATQATRWSIWHALASGNINLAFNFGGTILAVT